MNYKIPISSYIYILFKSFVFRIGFVFITIAIYFFATNSKFYNLKKSILLIFNTSLTKGEIIGCNYNEFDSFTTNYIIKEDPETYIYTTYLKKRISNGKFIDIKYNNSFPEYNRAINGSTTPSSIYIIPKVLFFLGLTLILIDFKIVLKTYFILKYGHITKAKLISQNNTDYEEYTEFHFEYLDLNNQKHLLSFETKNIKSVTDEDDELLIFDTRKPSKAIIIDSLPPSISNIIKQQ